MFCAKVAPRGIDVPAADVPGTSLPVDDRDDAAVGQDGDHELGEAGVRGGAGALVDVDGGAGEGLDEGVEATLEGFVRDFAGAGSFTLNGVAVDASGDVRFRGGDRSQLVEGARIHVDGEITSKTALDTWSRIAGRDTYQHNLAAARNVPKPGQIRMLVLAPTRELASQIAASARAYGQFMKLSVGVVFGGVSNHKSVREVSRGVPDSGSPTAASRAPRPMRAIASPGRTSISPPSSTVSSLPS